MNVENATTIVKSIAVLHNMIMSVDGFKPDENMPCEMPRNEANVNSTSTENSSVYGKSVREKFKAYFNSSNGSLPWQLSMI